MEIEALIVAGQYRPAIETTRQLLQSHADWPPQLTSVLNGLQAIAFHALGDLESADIYLRYYLAGQRIRTENMVATANRLAAIGARPAAQQVLQSAVSRDPFSQPALAGLIELELDDAYSTDQADQHLVSQIDRLLTMRRSSNPLLQRCYAHLASDRYESVPGRDAVLDRLTAVMQGQPQVADTAQL